jgi:hypothetical protein
MTNLKTVNVGLNRYCGPAVLSILTGKSTDECARVIGSINGQYSIAGVQLSHLLQAANKLGYDYYPVIPANSLYGTIVRIAMANEDGMYIITVPNHFVVIEVKDKRAFFCDNHTKEPIPASSSARLGQSVVGAHRVIKRPEPPPKPEPVLIRKEYRAGISNNRLYVDVSYLYEDEYDNRTEQVGFIQAQSGAELEEILRVIKEKIDE